MTHTTESLMELRKLAEAATKGPWIAGDDQDSDYYLIGPHDGDNIVYRPVVKIHATNNADFIAAANPAKVIELLDAITELVAERDALAKENERHKMHIKNIGNDALRTENHTLRAKLDALQSEDELPEPAIAASKLIPERSVMSDALYTETQVRQAVAMARAKMLAELGKVEPAFVMKWTWFSDYEGSWDIQKEPALSNRPEGATLNLYTHPLPAPESDLSGLKPNTQERIREWLTDGTFVSRAIGVMREQERELMTYEKAVTPAQTAQDVNMELAYDKVDRFLRNNLGDDDYAEYSEALDTLANAKAAQQKGGV